LISVSPAAAAAITASSRRMAARAELKLIDADILYLEATYSGALASSNTQQLHDLETAPVKTATVELNRWTLDGECRLVGDAPVADAEVGWAADVLSGEQGDAPEAAAWVQLNVSGLDVLQAAKVFFSPLPTDGVAVDFTFSVWSGPTLAYEEMVLGNHEPAVSFRGFAAYNVTALRVEIARWSLPLTRPRVVEIVPGVYEVWSGDSLRLVEVWREADFTCVTMPYSTAVLEIDNSDGRFSPEDPASILPMFEERQAVPLFFGVRLADGAYEWVPAGVYYQRDGGWETIDGGLLMKFSLVGIIGLLVGRKYSPPDVLPETLEGWVASIVAQIGVNFVDKYRVDESLRDFGLVCAISDVAHITCGELLRYACMAARAVATEDTATGALVVAPTSDGMGSELTLDNLSAYPVQRANGDIASLTVRLNDGESTELTINGTNSASARTLSVFNIFVKTSAQAQLAARHIIGLYSGHVYETRGRGDPRSEPGDVDVIELRGGAMVGGRRYKQQLKLSDSGIMKDMPSYFMQSSGEHIYEQVVVITQSGTWTAPTGVTRLHIILIGGGQGGQGGQGGDPFWMHGDGTPGAGGSGGLVYTADIPINSGQVVPISIGQGGAGGGPAPWQQTGGDGLPGGATEIWQYSSGDGAPFDGVVELITGEVYALAGQQGTPNCTRVTNGEPGKEGAGYGGQGGGGGRQSTYTIGEGGLVQNEVPAVAGGFGGRGGSGCAIISYDLPDGG
jgi:hypothetical protein